ncbi:arginase [Pseudooceanicola sediminis]|uniref:Arginase n=1 Tax=Pseudooceanicola sediminis TaxID=2211117 RepID=A0A399JBS9_9RHOB|nr:arginase [Pseudooceanicola sediminis]KAA2314280.1 arginase [Puniceibacterium sp. HSS470]RII40076.1 arginase [Pseudooceanicola sediminis]
MTRTTALLGAPIETGASQRGCIMGPDSLRTAGLFETLERLGWQVSDLGDLTIAPQTPMAHANGALHHLAETCAWIEVLEKAAYQAARDHDLPIFMGGDHSMAAGTVPGVARHAAEQNRPLFVLWLDSHPDLHTPESTESGNLHGTPMAYFTGQPGCDAYPPLAHAVDPENICLMGIRSVDAAEAQKIDDLGIDVNDMRTIDEVGILAPLRAFLERVRAANGMLHVSFDVDFLDPEIAPAVGTTVPGGMTFREAHLIMETLCDSGLVTSLELVELNPFLDEFGRTAKLLRDLTASLFGRRVLDRQTKSY